MVEPQHDLVAVLLHRLVGRALEGDLHAVVARQCPPHQPVGDVLLVPGVDVLAFAQVDDHRLAGLGEFHRSWFVPRELGPRTFFRFRRFGQEVGKLDPVERKIALAPLVAPALDHEREQVAILIGSARV